MKFGPVSPREAEGATAVHTIRQGSLVLKKGTLIGPAEVRALEAAGIPKIVVARLEQDDVSEDRAAAEIAQAVAGEGVRVDRAFTGRANLFADRAGILVVEKDAIDELNRVDEAITFATLAGLQAGGRRRDDRDGEDHPVRGRRTARARRRWRSPSKPFIRVAPYKIRKVGVISTILPGLSAKVVEKTLKITAGASRAGRRDHRRRAPRAARAGARSPRRSTRF